MSGLGAKNGVGMDTKIVYHVFTDGKDRYFEDEKEAMEVYMQWCKEHDRVRLWTFEDDGEELVDGDCLAAKGDFPC